MTTAQEIALTAFMLLAMPVMLGLMVLICLHMYVALREDWRKMRERSQLGCKHKEKP